MQYSLLPVGCPSLRKAFTLVELIATIAIVAVLAVMLVGFVGNYIAEARRTADRQTLTVLNDALTRYKTQGGDLSALTVGADIQNVLTKLRSPISWAGMQHQVFKAGETYASGDISVSGNGSSYKITRYGDYIDGTSYSSDITSNYSVSDPEAFETWIANAMLETKSTNYVVFTNPDTTQLFQIDVQVASSGDKVRVWWGDGTTGSFDSIGTSSNTAIYKDFGSLAARTIVVVGDVDRIESVYDNGRTDFGGSIETMKSLSYLLIAGNNTLSGNISDLYNLAYVQIGGENSISGSINHLSNLTHLSLWSGNNTVTGNLENLSSMTFFNVTGNNTLTGSIESLSNCNYVVLRGSNSATYPTTAGSVTWPDPMRWVVIRPGSAGVFTSSMVDSLLIDLSLSTTWIGEKAITLVGDCGARTSASDAAVATLQANGVTVTTN